MATLTVGAGKSYATISAAVAATHAGDVVAVDAGTYVDDFAVVNRAITIEGVGGQVTLEARSQPSNGKAILDVGADTTLVHLTFTGATVPDGNGAGVRTESTGNLTAIGCAFLGNQDGLLGAANPTGTITLLSSEFAGNGAGDGYTHNIYVGSIPSLDVEGCYIHDALGGNELKSRAVHDTITGNRIFDRSHGGAYAIDLSNGGNAVVSGNTIEKGPNSQQTVMIDFGSESPDYANPSLSVTGNTLISDIGDGYVLLNATTGTADISGNALYGFGGATPVVGPARLGPETVVASEPTLDTHSPIGDAALISVVAGAATTASPGQPVPLFHGDTLSVVGDGTLAITLSAAGMLAFTGTDLAAVTGPGGHTLTVSGLASNFVADARAGRFDYAGTGPADTVSVSVSGPNRLLLMPAGGAAVAVTSFAEPVTASVACYVAGTRIRTPRGEVAVEALRAGDLVLTQAGEARPVRWAARRQYGGVALRRDPGLRPVRIAAGAIAPGIPACDLLVSARHAMLLDDVLVPADALIDGWAIAPAPDRGPVAYFHLELDTHDVLLAEGAASESFCDCGNRWMFDNADATPAAVAPRTFCAPVVDDGPVLASIRARLAVRAAALAMSRRAARRIELAA